MLPPRGHFSPRGPLASVRQWPSKLPGDQNIHLSGVQNTIEAKLYKLWGKTGWKENFGDKFDRNAISGPFVRGASPPWSRARRPWKSSLPVYGNWGLSSETQVVLMSINIKKVNWKIFRKGEKIMLPIMLELISNNQKLLSLKWNLYLSRKNWI